MFGVLHIWNLAAAVILYRLLARRVQWLTDKQQKEIGVVYIIGGLLSMFFASVLYEIYPPRLEWILSARTFFYHWAVVGMVEESAKFLAFLAMVRIAGGIREPQDGVIFGAFVGIGFGTIENISYFATFGTEWYMWLRPILNTGGHGIYCAIWAGLYSQAVYANLDGRDPVATRNALLGVPAVAGVHALWNTLAVFLPAGILIKAVAAIVAVGIYQRSVELSPYRIYPFAQAEEAIRSIKRGLVFNPKSPTLNRHIGLYLMHVGKYRSAARSLRLSMQRSRDPRRARFLAVACETTFSPRPQLRRDLRIAWSRLSDSQRRTYLRQLEELVGDRDRILETIREFSEAAFAPRRYKNTREIAREQKIKRFSRRRSAGERTPLGERTADTIALLDGEDRARLARRIRGAKG